MNVIFLLACTVKAPPLQTNFTYPSIFKTRPPRTASKSAPIIIKEEVSSSAVYSFSLPPPENSLGDSLSLWATYYYTPIFPYSKKEKYAILDMKGRSFGPRLSAKDWCNAALQGSFSISYPSGKIQTFNYAGLSKKMQVNCKKYHRFTKSGRIRFMEARGPYGDGATGIYSLIPLRSIAVDPKLIPYGTVIYIPKAKGLKIEFSTGETIIHDGYFFANDTGGAIKKNHIDVYVGNEKHSELSVFVRSKEKETFSAYVIEDEEIQAVMKQAHKDITTRGRVFGEKVVRSKQD